jgi:hypothetical protein
VVAKARGTSSDASTEAEFLLRDKAGPFMILETLTEAVAVDETTNCEKKNKVNFIKREPTTTPIISDGRKNKSCSLGLPLPVKYKTSINHCIEEGKKQKKHTISTPVVQFTSGVTLGDVDFGEIADTGNLDVFRGLDKMDTLEGAVGDGAGATAGLGTVGDVNALGITNGTKVR